LLEANLKNIFIDVNTVDLEYFRGQVLKFKKDRNLLAKRKEYPKFILLCTEQLKKRKSIIQILKVLNILRNHEIDFLIVSSHSE